LSFGIGAGLNTLAIKRGSYNQPYLENHAKSLDGKKLDRFIRNSLDLSSLPLEEYMKNG